TGGFGSVGVDLTAVLTDPLSLLSVFDGLLASTEFFDPGVGAFSGGPNMLEPRALHTATALNGGSVLVAGGLTLIPLINIPAVSNTAYSYNTFFGTFGLPLFFDGPRLAHSAIKLDDGSVLLVGGLTVDLEPFLTSGGDLTQLAIGARDDILRYTSGLFTSGFSTVGTLSEPRALAGLANLPNGDTLIAGGFRTTLSATAIDIGASESADRFNLGSGTSATGSMGVARIQPLLETLVDGTVLVLGGGGLDAEIYQP
ncbi:MAG: Kelch repeat-containing protein, partial [Planctomycetota bacterium]